MKSMILPLLFLGQFLLIMTLSAEAQINQDYLGNWSFDAPNGTKGYTHGIITFQEDSVTTVFTDINYKFSSNWIEIKGDTLIYEADFYGLIVLFSIVINDKGNISGKAVWNGGETPMILTKLAD